MSKWCSICQSMVGYQIIPHILQYHVKEVELGTFKCRLCEKVLKKQAINYHFENHLTLRDPVACEICGKNFLTLRDFRSHQDRHLQYECHHCGRRLSTRKLIMNHILQYHFGAKRCYICAKIFHDEVEYLAHMKLERGKKKIKRSICDICGYTANGPEMMWHHRNKNHSAAEVICTE